MNANGILNNTKPEINDQSLHLLKGRDDVEKKKKREMGIENM